MDYNEYENSKTSIILSWFYLDICTSLFFIYADFIFIEDDKCSSTLAQKHTRLTSKLAEPFKTTLVRSKFIYLYH